MTPARIILVIFSFQVHLAFAEEIDLTSPQAAFKSCLFERYDKIPKNTATSIISNCFTEQGKLALFSYVYLGTSMLEAVEEGFSELDGSPFNSELDNLNAKYLTISDGSSFEQAILSLSEENMDAFLLELLLLSNKYSSKGFQKPKILKELVISDGSAEGYVLADSFDKKEAGKYKLFFKQTDKGWLIDEIGNFE